MRSFRDGQVATILLIVMAAVLLLSMTTFNIGMVALTKTSTANAADAGSLAAVSWVASAQNEVAMGPAKTMWTTYKWFNLLLKLPFANWYDVIPVWLAFQSLQGWRSQVANELLHAGWEQAHATAITTALNNLDVDDPRPATESGSFKAWMHELDQQFRAIQEDEEDELEFPSEVTFTWDRQPDDAERGEQSFTVQVEFTQAERPEFTTSMWGPIAKVRITGCIAWCCWSTLMWNFKWFGVYKQIAFLPLGIGFFIPWFSTPPTCIMLPIPLVAFGGAKPSGIENGDGRIRVTVTRTTQSTDLRLWRMDYPEEIVSVSEAGYNTAKVSYPTRDTSVPRLWSTQ